MFNLNLEDRSDESKKERKNLQIGTDSETASVLIDKMGLDCSLVLHSTDTA